MTAAAATRIAALSREKRALLVQRNPLSFAQQRLWFLDQLEPGGHLYNVPVAVRLEGAVALGALARALGGVVRRHAVLRTAFPAPDGTPMQLVSPPGPVALPVVDLTGLDAGRREPEADRLTAREIRRPFDLAAGPPFRALAVVEDAAVHRIVLTVHHAVTDGWSFDVIVRELGALLAGRGEALPEPPVQYLDYARWQRSRLQGETLERLLAFWRGRLAGLVPDLALPTDRPRPQLPSHRGGAVVATLPAAETERVTALGRAEGATPFMVLLALFQALLARLGGRSDVAVGSPVVNRDRVELESLVGLFQNTLVLRTDLAGDPSFRALLGRVRETTLSAHAHQELPFERLVDELQPERALDRQPLFEAIFTLKAPRRATASIGGLRTTLLEARKRSAKADLTLTAAERDGRLQLELEYADDLFLETTAARILRAYRSLVAAALEDADLRLSALPLLATSERHQLLCEWNDTGAGLLDPVDRSAAVPTIGALVGVQAASRPSAPALVSRHESLAYAELVARARRLARRLRCLGVGPEVRVGLYLERTAEMVVAMLAVLEAGGAYVPLDPSFPVDRLAGVLADSGASVVVTEGALPGELAVVGARILDLAAAAPEIAAESDRPLAVVRETDALAYVLYTSGSTGRPKGVAVTHRSVVSFLRSLAGTLGAGPSDALLAVTTLSFDIAGLEIFLPLVTGGRIELVDRETAADGDGLRARLESSGATLMQATPATWRMLIDAGWPGTPGLRALCGGEALPPDLAAALAGRTDSLHNVYGPTETTIWSTVQRIESGGAHGAAVSLGRPIAGTRIEVAPPPEASVGSIEPAPVGVAGELRIAGVGLARGYHARPGVTAERFVPDPFATVPGGRTYRTGDLVRRNADGTLAFLGRADHQVKVRGFRVEPGEVEIRLSEHPAVREATVVARPGEGGHSVLAAYWVAENGAAEPAIAELRSFLRQRLPDYMVPSLFTRLEALPLTPNGKIDRAALPRPERAESPSTGIVAPRTPSEEMIAGVWAEILGRPEIAVHDDFFELGGHSLLATQVVSRLRRLFEIDLPLRALFEGPTVAALAVRMEAARRAGDAGGPPAIEPAARDEALPLSFAQQRLWFLDQLEPGSPFYNLAAGVRLVGPLRPSPLAAALRATVARHEALRTVFPVVGGRPSQRVQPIAEVAATPLAVVDLSGLPAPARAAELERAVGRHGRRPFDLERGPLVRAAVVRTAAHDHVLVIGLHHIVGDRWSLAILVRELAAFYRAFDAGETPALPALPVQYADFALWQRSYLEGAVLDRQLEYWRRRLAGAPELLRLPLDRPRPDDPTRVGARHRVVLPRALAASLRRFGQGEGATLFMVLFTGFAATLERASGQTDLVVGANVANRHYLETEGLIGFFANLLPLRTDLAGAPSFREALARVRESALGAYAHQDAPFDRIVEAVDPVRDPRYSPLVQVVFSFQNVPGTPPVSPDLRIEPLRSEPGTAKFDLVLDLVDGEEGITATFEYDRELFEPTTVAGLAASFGELLAAAAARPDRPLAELAGEIEARRVERRRAEGKRFETDDVRMLRRLRGARSRAKAS